ncbi:MAG: hypothetical protein KA144_09840 [Xanthomonadaceae bacterium]|nr:hypothetical protein [Xanthomonadaceae bacterium]
MTAPAPAADQDAIIAARRASARRTAWIVAGIAIAVYVGFILMNVLSQ